MSDLTITLPDAMRDFIERQVAERGLSSPGEYFQGLLRQEQLRVEKARLEELLLEGLNSGPPIEANDQYWRDKKARLMAQYAERVEG